MKLSISPNLGGSAKIDLPIRLIPQGAQEKHPNQVYSVVDNKQSALTTCIHNLGDVENKQLAVSIECNRNGEQMVGNHI